MNDSAAKMSALVIDALQYAHDHNLDVTKKEDVSKILDALDPNHTQNLDTFFEILKTSDVYLDMKARKLEEKRPKLPS